MKLSDYVIQFVEKQNIKHVFMLPGGGSMHLVDSLGKSKKLRYICNLHEQAAAIAADAYSQYTNNLGVVLVTTGPGGTNTITGVAGAWLDSVPVLFISGQVKTPDLMGSRKVRQIGFQEIDIVSLVKPITKYAVTVTDEKTIKYHLEKALHLAKSGRPGPVWIDIPLDIQAADINEKKIPTYKTPKEKKIPFLAKRVAKVVKLLQKSQNPVILVGNGVRLADAEKELQELLEILKIPVLATWKSIDFFPENHPYYVGRPGTVAQRGANFTQQKADCLIVLGARLDFGQTAYNHKNFAPKAKKIIVDADKNEIKKMETHIAVPVACDAKLFLQEILKYKKTLSRMDHSNWLNKCKTWQKKYPVLLPEYKTHRGVNDYVLLEALSQEMNAKDLLVPGSSGACSERTMQAFKVKKGMRVFNSQGLGAMGFGVPMALGACLASGKKRTICIDGDGGFIMNVQELQVIRNKNLPIKFFILNNSGYASIRISQENYFNKNYVASSKESGLLLPDYQKIAKAFGIPSYKIKNSKELHTIIRKTFKTKGPVICEVFVDPKQVTAPRVMSKKLANGQMESSPMEDLWPFLDRKEFFAIME